MILSGLSYSHRAGTARTACEQVFDATPLPRHRLARRQDRNAELPERRPLARRAGAALRARARRRRQKPKRGACSSLQPYKWYVAAYRADRAKDGPWTKAIAVLTERNWLRASGRVHGAGDHGPNPAAEIAMQIVGRRTGAIDEAAP